MNPKVLIGLLVVVLLAFLGFTASPALGVGILVIGAGGVIFAVTKMGDGGGRKKKVNDFSANESTGSGARTATSTAVADDEDNLPAWGGMTAWSGSTETEEPADFASFDTGFGTADDTAGEGLASWDAGESWSSDTTEADSGDTWGTWQTDTATAEDDTLDLDTEFEQTFGSGEYDALGGLDDATAEELPSFADEPAAYDEPVAEPESSAFSFGSAPKPINEDVSTADDIMAASAATEFHVAEEGGDGATENSELAKLLAKVQARLSAYE